MATRREFLKKTGYAAPAILTLTASPSFGGSGSVRAKTRTKKKPKRKPKKPKTTPSSKKK